MQPQHYVPIDIIHQSMQLPKLDVRRETHLVNFMFKQKNNKKYLNNRDVRTRLHDAPVFKYNIPKIQIMKSTKIMYFRMEQ